MRGRTEPHRFGRNLIGFLDPFKAASRGENALIDAHLKNRLLERVTVA
jgi:hypothetical protein